MKQLKLGLYSHELRYDRYKPNLAMQVVMKDFEIKGSIIGSREE